MHSAARATLHHARNSTIVVVRYCCCRNHHNGLWVTMIFNSRSFLLKLPSFPQGGNALHDPVAIGRPQNLSVINELIIGGEEISIRQFPWQVSIAAGSLHICGGTILSPTKILTAAHCFAALNQGQLLRHIRVRAGSSRHNEKGTVREIVRAILHPEFNQPTRINNDIAVLILKVKLDINSRDGKIRAIAMPRAGEALVSGIDLKVSGWGLMKNGNNGPLATKLRFVVVQSIERRKCEDAFKNLEKTKFTNRMICAGIWNVGGKDACQGDSGGLFEAFIFIITGDLI